MKRAGEILGHFGARSSLDDRESKSAAAAALYEDDSDVVVSCFTIVEVESAIWRRHRVTHDDERRDRAKALLDELESRWAEVDDVPEMIAYARDVISRHPLRAADAMQLACALSLAGDDKSSLPFVTLDHKLAGAARAEGLTVIEPA